MKKLICLLLFVVCLIPFKAMAGEVVNKVDMTFQLLEGCVFVDTPPVNLLHYIINESSEVNTKITFACTAGTSYTFEVGVGQNAEGGVRRAKLDDKFAKYRMFWGDSNVEILVDSGNTKQGVGNNQLIEEVIKVRLSQSENEGLPYGVYTDVINLKLTW